MATRYFFSGNHRFYHGNAIHYFKRPFNTMEEMHEEYVSAWNRVVTDNDVVVYTGNLSFGGYGKTLALLKELNGGLLYVAGKHDSPKTFKALQKSGKLIRRVNFSQIIEVEGQKIYISHYPHLSWPSDSAGSFHVYSEPNGQLDKELGKSLDASVDAAFSRGLRHEPMALTYLRAVLDCRNIHKKHYP